MTEHFQTAASNDMPSVEGVSAKAQLLIWLTVRLGIPFLFSLIFLWYILTKDKLIESKDANYQALSSQCAAAYLQNAVATEHLSQTIHERTNQIRSNQQ